MVSKVVFNASDPNQVSAGCSTLMGQGSTTTSLGIVNPGAVGYLTTWNQECGIARYAEKLILEYPTGCYVILAEDVASGRRNVDEKFVERCWQRGSTDFSKLKNVIEFHNIKILHLNLHQAGIFPIDAFCNFLIEMKSKEVKIVVQLHSTFTSTEALRKLGSCIDQALVHTGQNRLQLVANGWLADKIIVVPHGISDNRDKLSLQDARSKLSIPSSRKVVLSFGFVQPHKGMESLIQGIKHLHDKGLDVHGYIVGGANPADPRSQKYLGQLKELCAQLNVQEKIHFVEGFVEEATLEQYIVSADVVLFDYQSQHFESSGACATALSYGKVIATSLAPAFTEYEDAVWVITSGFPMSATLEALLFNEELRQSLLQNVNRVISDRSWRISATAYQDVYKKSGIILSPVQKKELKAITTSSNSASMRVLMQNRPNAYTQPGGDTVVMEKTRIGLEKRGVLVTVDLEAKEDPRKYDLVHLFNFATPDYTRTLAEKAHSCGVPYVVTTLYEDVPVFHRQSHALAGGLLNYIASGQNKEWYKANKPNLETVQPSQRFENSWTAKQSAGLFVTGPTEGKILERDYGSGLPIFSMMLGCEVAKNATAQKFIEHYGVKDFVLCVGRLETRKNQLMLLKALEDDDVTVVIAGSGFTYQPEYAEAVKNFKRRGKTIVLGRLNDDMLASAYCAAKVHVLPSFYELPGLVTLEAANYGCNIVASGNCGTIEDYFGELAIYCDPKDEKSIRDAVLKALQTPRNKKLKEIVEKYSWDDLGERAFAAYQQILKQNLFNKNVLKQEGADMAPTFDMDTDTTTFQDLLDRGEVATKSRRNEEAKALFDQAEQINPKSVRLLMARGTLNLASGDIDGAKKYFDRALAVNSDDPKSLVGRGMCEVMNKNHAIAYDYFVKALSIAPTELVAIHQLIECSFVLNRFSDITVAIEKYLNKNPQDIEMRFCLAGCYYKSQNLLGAKAQLQAVMSQNATHRGAQELSARIVEEERKLATQAMPEVKMPIPQASAGIETLPNASVVYLEEATPETKIIIPEKPRNTSIDMQLAELNEKKRNREIDSVKSGCDLVLRNPDTNQEQIEFAKILLAETSILEGDLEKATALYQEVTLVNPRNARALCGQAALNANSNDWLGAEELFSQALKYDSKSDLAYAGLGMCAAQMRNVEKAWGHYRAALKINPENLRAVLGVIELGYPMKRLSEVEEAVRGYLELHSADCNFMYSLAGCLFAQERYHESLEELERLIMFEPANQHALELRSMIMEKLGIGAATQQRIT